MPSCGSASGGRIELVVGVACRDEGQRIVVEHHVHDDGAARRDIGTVVADGPARVEQPALFGAERRRLLENLPLTAGLAPALGRRYVVGQVQSETAGKQADQGRRARAKTPAARWPDPCATTAEAPGSMRVTCGRGGRVRSGHVEAIDLLQNGRELLLQLRPLVGRLARVLLFDEAA